MSETNLDDLIQKIKTEGIDEAEKEAQEVIREAQQRGAEIIAEAKKEAENILREVEREIKKKEEISRRNLVQGARDIIIATRNNLVEIVHIIMKEKTRKALSGELLETILLKIVDGWQADKNKEVNLSILLNTKEKQALRDGLLSELKSRLKGDIELKVHPDIEAGFRIGVKGEAFYYDFTDESIAEALAFYLNPELSVLFNVSLLKNPEPDEAIHSKK